MIDLLLHAGSGHAELTWIVVAAVLALATGLAIGTFSQRVSSWFTTDQEESPDRQ